MTAPQLTRYVNGQGIVSGDQANTFEQTCDDVVQLRALIGVTGMQVFIRGFVTPGDGGAGPFYWNTTATGPDNGNSVIVPQPGVPGAWVRLGITEAAITILPNIAGLRGLSGGSLNPVVFVEGYYNPADGGQGVFVYVPTDTTSADNGGTIIVDAGGHRYYREWSGLLPVQFFGAVGNGAFNDGPLIQEALTYAGSIGGAIVYMPPTGHGYVVTTGLTVPSGVTLQGAGSRNSVVDTSTVAQWTQDGSWIIGNDPVNPAVILGGNGAAIIGINFIHTQPIPGATFTPTVWPATIYTAASYVIIRDIEIVAGTIGVEINYPTTGGGAGNIIENVRANVFGTGLITNNSTDTFLIKNFVVRSVYYASNAVIQAYVLANVVGWGCTYCANIVVEDFLASNAAFGLLLNNSTAIALTNSMINAQITNMKFVGVHVAIGVGANNTVFSAAISNLQVNSAPADLGTLLALASDAVDLVITNLVVTSGGGTILLLGGGTSGKVAIANLDVQSYSANAAGLPCFTLNAGSQLSLGNRSITKPAGAGPLVSGGGNIRSSKAGQWQPFTLNTANYTGTGAAQTITPTSYYDLVGTGAIQARLTGDILVVTPIAGGTALLGLLFIGEVVTTVSVAAGGTVPVDTGWVDITQTAPTNIGGISTITTSGAVVNPKNLAVQWR